MDKKIYKNLIIVSLIILAIIVVFLIGNVKESKKYSGFMQPARGAWSEIMNGAEETQRFVYLGERTIDNVLAYGVEIRSTVSESEGTTIQVWRNQDSDAILKIAGKLAGESEVICIDHPWMEMFMPGFSASLPVIKTPEEYGLNGKYIPDTFVTKKGKEIRVAKFINEDNIEIWLSSAVPFGIVKVLDWGGGTGNAEIKAWLQDFGLSGDGPTISEAEMINCQEINFPDVGE